MVVHKREGRDICAKAKGANETLTSADAGPGQVGKLRATEARIPVHSDSLRLPGPGFSHPSQRLKNLRKCGAATRRRYMA